ncbi:MAG TPA: BLUF domain-containing protein [Burkholderiaceae bacterium]|nr:BLUF domain-containing protein [Burkholderiaceae bacterium]
MLVRLLYASRIAPGAGADAIESILAHSRRHNPEFGITGILCHGGDVFIQVLEGGREPVNRLYGQIARDGRHRDVTLLHYEEITERCFSSWTMGQVNLAKVNPSLLLKHSERPVLDPFQTSGRASFALLQELIATASIIGRA